MLNFTLHSVQIVALVHEANRVPVAIGAKRPVTSGISI